MTEILPAGITSSGISVTNGEQWSIYGTVISFIVSLGGTETVFSGGTAISTTIRGGTQNVSSGGVASFTTVSDGGYLNVYESGATSFTRSAAAAPRPCISAVPPSTPRWTAVVPI
jgi:autotransporter passenger strand-loop-strand repeat protein